jgi:hypothetical protein
MRVLMAGTGSGGDRNFEDTVLTQVDLEQYAGSLTADERQFLTRLHGRFASVWGVPVPNHSGITAATNLQPCDQVWFHHVGLVHHVATVMAVFHNLDFDRALWGDDPYPPSGFVFTLAEPQAARIAKAEINRLLGHEIRFTWQGNLLITEEMSRRLADAVELILTD